MSRESDLCMVVRCHLGEGHSRFTDEQIIEARRSFYGRPSPVMVAQRLLHLWRGPSGPLQEDE